VVGSEAEFGGPPSCFGGEGFGGGGGGGGCGGCYGLGCGGAGVEEEGGGFIVVSDHFGVWCV